MKLQFLVYRDNISRGICISIELEQIKHNLSLCRDYHCIENSHRQVSVCDLLYNTTYNEKIFHVSAFLKKMKSLVIFLTITEENMTRNCLAISYYVSSFFEMLLRRMHEETSRCQWQVHCSWRWPSLSRRSFGQTRRLCALSKKCHWHDWILREAWRRKKM